MFDSSKGSVDTRWELAREVRLGSRVDESQGFSSNIAIVRWLTVP